MFTEHTLRGKLQLEKSKFELPSSYILQQSGNFVFFAHTELTLAIKLLYYTCTPDVGTPIPYIATRF